LSLCEISFVMLFIGDFLLWGIYVEGETIWSVFGDTTPV